MNTGKEPGFSAGQRELLKTKKILAGFDGFIDSIYRPLKKSGTEKVYFNTIAEFGNYIAGRAGKNASIELELIQRRMGGNMPNFIRAASALGADCACIGMLSDKSGALDPVFASLPEAAYSWTEAGEASALEFDDGKIFLAQGALFEGDPWQAVTEKTGAALEGMVRDADLIALVNWSELSFAERLWKSFYRYCAKTLTGAQNKFILIDLCDMGRKSPDEIKDILALAANFSSLRYVILSLNRNEASQAASALGFSGGDDPESLAAAILEGCAVNEALIHSKSGALSLSKAGCFRLAARNAAKPKISTGAGDTFNAAYGLAAVLGLAVPKRLELAQAAARRRITTGSV
jgi:hypothetical protein